MEGSNLGRPKYHFRLRQHKTSFSTHFDPWMKYVQILAFSVKDPHCFYWRVWMSFILIPLFLIHKLRIETKCLFCSNRLGRLLFEKRCWWWWRQLDDDDNPWKCFPFVGSTENTLSLSLIRIDKLLRILFFLDSSRRCKK